MNPTLKLIAEKTGYSISTISRSLSNSSSISTETRMEVQRVAEDIGYRPAKKKRVRKKSKQPHFALLSDFRIGEFYAAFFCGYREASYIENSRISLLSVRDQRKECVKFIQQIQRENNFDGIILFFPALKRSHYEQILDALPKNYPIISNALIDNPNITTITFDSYNGGHIAAAHLHQQGYKRLGIIQGPKIKPESRFRYNGFIDYVHQHKDITLTWVFNGKYEYENGIDAYKNFKEQSKVTGVEQVCDAVFATNDTMACGFMEAAKADGNRIPDDIAILGYDNLPASDQRTPTLSSIHTDFVGLASSSIRTLKNKLRNQGYQQGTLSLVPVTLAPKASTSP